MLWRLFTLTGLVTAGLLLATAVISWDRSDNPAPPNLETTEAFARSRLLIGMPLIQTQSLPIGAAGRLNGYEDEETGCIYLATRTTLRPVQGPSGRPSCFNPNYLWSGQTVWSTQPASTRARVRDRSHARVYRHPDPRPEPPVGDSGQTTPDEPVPSNVSNAGDDAAGDGGVSQP